MCAVTVAVFFNAGIGTLYLRLANNLEKPPTETISTVTDNLQKLIAMDSSLARNEQINTIKQELLGHMQFALESKPAPLLGHNMQEMMYRDTIGWMSWILGILMSAFVMAFAAFLIFEVLKKALAVRSVAAPPLTMTIPNAEHNIQAPRKKDIG